MDVMDSINILKKYNMYDLAKVECKRRKIDESPYDMQGHHDVYCEFLSKKWVEIRNEKIKLQKITCKKWGVIPNDIKPRHNSCDLAVISLADRYCKVNCEYYSKIKKLQDDMKELQEAQNVLKDEAEYDFYHR
ncbi:MAG: hypothetical protein ACLRWO_13175 [Clostridium butyricum]